MMMEGCWAFRFIAFPALVAISSSLLLFSLQSHFSDNLSGTGLITGSSGAFITPLSELYTNCLQSMAGMKHFLFAALAVATIADPKVSPRPPMGFNNWARFMCNLNETLFTTTADAMASSGLLAAGYNNINLDDCWSKTERNAKGELEWNTTLFPHGMPWLGDYLHRRGFNFGIYTNAGNMSCGLYPGSQDHEELDSKTFEKWGVDYLKVDGCHMDLQNGRTYYQEFEYRYKLWHEILHTKLKKPFIFSQSAPAYFSPNFHLDLNNTDWYRTMDYIRSNGELARHSDDIKVYGNNPTNTFEPGGHWDSIMNNYNMQVRLSRYQSCGFFNDPDFLIVDWPDLSLDEKKTHFALWSSFSAPLILSAWIPDLKKEEIEYLTNRDIIAVDQDPLCEQATLVSQSQNLIDILTKSLANGDILLTVLNKGNKSSTSTIPLQHLGIDTTANTTTTEYTAKDLWTGKTTTLTSSSNTIPVTLNPHQTAIYRISSSRQAKIEKIPTGQIFNTFSMNCLSAPSSPSYHERPVTLTPCTAAPEQIWQISPKGLITSLASDSLCLSVDNDDDDKVYMRTCTENDKDEDEAQTWRYGVGGNLVNGAKGKNKATTLCLSEVEEGGVRLAECGIERDEQVFAVPGGVELV